MVSPKKLFAFKNIHKGERAFIIGNGPSLRKTPLEKLVQEYTFSTNRINKIYPNTDWRPTYFSYTQSKKWAENHNSYEDIKETVNSNTTCFIAPEHSDIIEENNNIFF